MKIKILGSGTILSSEKRNQAGYILHNAADIFLVDIGSGILKQLIIAGYDVRDIQSLFISHFHADHCSDLLPFLLRRHLLEKGINKRLKIYGPPGLKVWIAGQSVFQGEWLTDSLPQLIELNDAETYDIGMQVRAMPNGHTENSISLMFAGEKTLFYSSDTGFNRDLIPFAENADAALMECSMPDDLETEGHLTPAKTGDLAAEAHIRKLIVTHIYPENDTADLKERISRYYSGGIIVAEDFFEIEL